MNRIIFLLLSAVLSVVSFGQNQAKILLQEVRKNTLALQDQTIEFTNTLDASSGDQKKPRVKRELKGKVYAKGTNYRVDMGDQIIYLNNSKAYLISPDDEEITVRKLADDNSIFSPAEILKKYENNSSMKFAGSKKVNGAEIQYILLKPKASEDIKEIQLGINMKTKLLYSYQENGTNGVISTVVIDKYTVNSGMQESQVIFMRSNYPGYEIFEPRVK